MPVDNTSSTSVGSTVTANAGSGTFAVYFSPSTPAVNATFSAASMQVSPTTGSRVLYEEGQQAVRALIVGSQANASLQISGITNSINVYVGATGGTLNVKLDPSSVVQISNTPSVSVSNTPTVTANAGTGTFNVQLDPGHTIGNIGSVNSITSTVGMYLDSTKGTVIIKPDPAGTFFTNAANTAGIFTVSGSTSGVSVSGVTLVAPSSAYNFKVFAYTVHTTGIVSLTVKFTNGSGSSPTEFWRPISTSAATSSIPVGANFGVQPPGYLFATGTNTTLAMVLDTASLVHYSVSYIKESA